MLETQQGGMGSGILARGEKAMSERQGTLLRHHMAVSAYHGSHSSIAHLSVDMEFLLLALALLSRVVQVRSEACARTQP